MFVRYLLLLSLCDFAYTRYIKDSEDYDGSEGDASKDIYIINEKAQSQEKGVTIYQADMILTAEQIATLNGSENSRGDPIQAWPSVTRNGSKNIIISYTVHGFVGKNIVEKAAAHIKEKVPCINFVDKTRKIRNENHIRFINGAGGCYSYVGKVDFRKGDFSQEISLRNPDCLSKGIAVHQMMHTLGYFHEQSRADRDNYVRIVRENIIPGFSRQFEKMKFRTENTVYDYGSIMHFAAYVFSKNSKATIMRLDGGAASTLGQMHGLSELDARKLRMKYCGEAETTERGSTPPPTTQRRRHSSFKR